MASAICSVGACSCDRSHVGTTPDDWSAGGAGSAENEGGASQAGAAAQPSTGEQILYNVGVNGADTVAQLLVDADLLYWSQKPGKLMRGPKDGTGPVEQFGGWTDAPILSSRIVADGDFIYWYDGRWIKRRAKQGGETQSFDLGGDELGWGGFTVHDGVVYWANRGCQSIMTLDPEGVTAPRTFAPDDFGQGVGAQVEVLAGKLFCAHMPGDRLIEMTLDTGQFTVVYDGIVRGIAKGADALFVLTGPYRDPGVVQRLDVATRQLQQLGVDVAMAGLLMQFDAVSNALFINHYATAGTVTRFNLSTGGGDILLSGRPMREGIAVDDAYVYWAQWGPEEPEQILRIPKGASPVPFR